MRKAFAALSAVAVAVVAVVVVTTSESDGATAPGVPINCAAQKIVGSTDDFHLSWSAPSNDGGDTVWRYVVKVKGQSTPVVQLDSPNHDTVNTTSSYNWVTPVTGSPPTFQIRAVNDIGFGPWCEPVGQSGSTPTPTPTPTPTATPTTATPTPTPTEPPQAGRPFIPYSGDAFLKSRLLFAPTNSALTAEFRAFMSSNPEQAGTTYPVIRGVGTNKFGMVYAEGKASDPVWKLTGTVPSQVADLKTTGFHAPEFLGSTLTGTSDSPFVVMDRASGKTIWGAKAVVGANHTINVGASGAFQHASNGLDQRNPLSNSNYNFRSRGVIPDSMVIRKDMMDWAKANNSDLGQTLELFFVETDSAEGFTNPMVGAESGKSGWGAEGWRIAVSPSVDLAARNCSAEARVIARTLQNYGTYLGDNAGSQTSLKAEQESSAHPVWGGVLTANELQGCISWSDFVVIEPGWPGNVG